MATNISQKWVKYPLLRTSEYQEIVKFGVTTANAGLYFDHFGIFPIMKMGYA